MLKMLRLQNVVVNSATEDQAVRFPIEHPLNSNTSPSCNVSEVCNFCRVFTKRASRLLIKIVSIHFRYLSLTETYTATTK